MKKTTGETEPTHKESKDSIFLSFKSKSVLFLGSIFFVVFELAVNFFGEF